MEVKDEFPSITEKGGTKAKVVRREKTWGERVGLQEMIELIGLPSRISAILRQRSGVLKGARELKIALVDD